MTSIENEFEEVSPKMFYWMLGIILVIGLVYLYLGITVDAASAADFVSDPSQFTFVCPLGEYH